MYKDVCVYKYIYIRIYSGSTKVSSGAHASQDLAKLESSWFGAQIWFVALFGINLCPRFLASVFHQMKKRNDFARGSVIFWVCSLFRYVWLKESFTGWWFQPVWKILVNGKDYPIYYVKKHVPNHQTDLRLGTTLIYPCTWWSLEAGTNACLWTNTNQPSNPATHVIPADFLASLRPAICVRFLQCFPR